MEFEEAKFSYLQLQIKDLETSGEAASPGLLKERTRTTDCSEWEKTGTVWGHPALWTAAAHHDLVAY